MTLRERIVERIESDYGCEAEHLWLKYPNAAVFRHPGSGKWFALMMDVAADKLGLPGAGAALPSAQPMWVITVKCDPLMRSALLKEPGFLPAYHMNKASGSPFCWTGACPKRAFCRWWS